MEYSLYLSLFEKAKKLDLSNFLDKDFYDEITRLIDTKSHFQIKDTFNQTMLSFIESENDYLFDIKELRELLVRQYFWTQAEEDKNKFLVFEMLTLYFGSKVNHTKNQDAWIKAIAMANFSLSEKINYVYQSQDIERSYIEQYNSVSACKYFNSLGFDISVKKGKIQLKNINLIFNYLNKQAEKLGSRLYTFLIDVKINANYNVKNGLYIFPLDTSYKNLQPNLPYGLVYQLSLKFIHLKCQYKDKYRFAEAYEDFINSSVKYASLFELQNYGHDYATIFMNNSQSLLDKLQAIVLADSFFKIEQYIPKDVFKFLHFLISRYENESDYSSEIIKFKSMISFIKIKLQQENSEFLPHEIPNNIDENFLSLFVFNKVNQNFINWNDFDKLDFNEKCLMLLESRYIILPSEFSLISLYRILTTILEKNTTNIKKLKSELGTYIEGFIKEEMEKKGFNGIYSREYSVALQERSILGINSEKLECDVLLQSNNYIAFMEMKKKELTKISRKGNIVFILNDLALSLLDSQKQANRHMRYIKEFNKIKFDETDSLKEIEVTLNQREIIKISVSSLDYLSLHSKTIFHRFLSLLYNKEIVLTEPASQEERHAVKKFNISNQDYSKELNNIHSDFQLIEQNGFYNTFYLNIFHLIYLINQCNNIEEFFSRLISVRGVILNYKDIYHELSYMKFLENFN